MDNTKYWENRVNRLIRARLAQIDRIFKEAAEEAARLGVSLNVNTDKPFRFSDYPATKQRIDNLMKEVHDNLQSVVVNGVDGAWKIANDKEDEFCKAVFSGRTLTKEQKQRYFNHSDKAREAFALRKTAGLNLSDRVWRYTEQFKQEIEMGLDLGIGEGRSAADMARDLKRYLREPDKLFRRVRDKRGNLQLSKNAAAYHPGAGVYRSSYKNALRLTRTETNMAYRTADQMRYQSLDFVVGIEIHTSNNHPVTDICDELKGKYPKDFKFVGWHPQCRCYVTSILKTEKEIEEATENILNSEYVSDKSVNTVSDVPQNFKDWCKENQERIASAKSIPYFLSDNEQYVLTYEEMMPGIAEHSQFQGYAYRYYADGRSDKFKTLYKKYLDDDGLTDVQKAMIVKEMKDEAAEMTYQNLKEWGAIGEDWVVKKTEFNKTIQKKLSYTVGKNVVKIDEQVLDVIVFADKNGVEYAYPVGLTKEELLFNATDASKVIGGFPPYLRKGIDRVSFFDMPCPTDEYWKVKYNNPGHVSLATDGGETTFWHRVESPDAFQKYMSHEAAHIIDAGNRFSGSKEWQEAVALDGDKRVSPYARTNDSEDFAECMKEFICNREWFIRFYPHRAAYLKSVARQLSGYYPKRP